MDAKELFKQALFSSNSAVDMVTPGDFSKPTPDTGWDVKTLASHMLYELSWTADIVRSQTLEEVGGKYDGDLIGDDLQASWRRVALAAVEAVEACDLKATANLSYGETSVEDYLREAASDQLIHSWDLSAALGRPVSFDRTIAEKIYKETLPRQGGMEASGLFAPALSVPRSADYQTKLLALFGRDANWRPPA